MRNKAALLAMICLAVPMVAQAAKWVRNPSQPGQWIDLDSRKHTEEVVSFKVSLSVDADTGQPSTADDDLVIELLNCIDGKRTMILPMLGNDTRALPTLSQDDPLMALICG
ncbi:MAG: hypothetical protein GC190_07200 [Alphaproteobacteria bacterium]|nr:hypothetical protein [Alphaproteobacteria bacterium]